MYIHQLESSKPGVVGVMTINFAESSELTTETFTVDGFQIPVSHSLPSVLMDLELNDYQGWNSLAASRPSE